MAQRMPSFIYNRAPRATGLSDKAIDEHKELIRDLYLTRNYTRDQVIVHLKTEQNFNLSPDQFSKAIRRWGFRKQFHSGKSTQQPLNETASADATTNTASYILSCIGAHPAFDVLNPFTLPCPPEKQLKPTGDLDDILDIEGDGDITASTPTEDKSIEPSLPHQSARELLVSAEYLACCYDYTEAFDYYITLSTPFQDLHSYKERRANILDMARVASTRRTCELVRLMLEAELEMSNDPLAEKGHTQSSPDMSRMQSFLFHRHLAQIYARQNDRASMQKHLDIARNFSNAFNTHGTESIDLWTLLFFVQDKKYSQIPELLGSLKWDYESYCLDIDHCLQHCWRKLNPTKSLREASIMYDAGRRTKTEPAKMSDLILQSSSLYLWERSSILFTFLWKEIQLTHGTLPWMEGHPAVSATHILMIVSRMIVKRSCLISKHPDDLNEPEGHVQIHPISLKIYCDTLLGLFHDRRHAPGHIKREFATQFIEHHTWSLPSEKKGAPASQTQSSPIEAPISDLAIRRDDLTTHHLSTTMKERTTSPKKASENQRESTDNDFSKWIEENKGQSVFGRLANDDSYVRMETYSSRSTHALNGNPTISRTLASHSSCSSQKTYSSSLQRFKAAGLNLQHRPNPTMTLSENPDVLMDEDILENLQEDEYQTGIWAEWERRF